jgi:hypothetical protein
VTTTKTLIAVVVVLTSITLLTRSLNALEQPDYEVVDDLGDLQIRKYQPHTVARTLVSGTFKEVGNQGFRRLADFIFGGNDQNQKIAMTAPVGLVSNNESSAEDRYWVTFSMPSEHSLQELPKPDDERVAIVEVPQKYLAVVKYKGNWSEKRYRHNETRLLSLLDGNDTWVKKGEMSFNRYNPPFVPGFMRTNEVAVEVVPNNQVEG